MKASYVKNVDGLMDLSSSERVEEMNFTMTLSALIFNPYQLSQVDRADVSPCLNVRNGL
jgi:hypothetical protein